MGQRVLLDIVNSEKATLYLFDAERGGLITHSSVALGAGMRPEAGLRTEGDLIVSIPLSLLDLRVLNLPFDDPERISDVLNFELDGLVLGDPASLAADACPTGRKAEDGASEAIAAYAPRTVIRELLDNLKAVGMDPRVITSLELGVVRAALARGVSLAEALSAPQPVDFDARTEAARAEAMKPSINLRRGDLRWTAATDKVRRGLLWASALGALAMFLLAAHFWILYRNADREIRGIEARTLKLYAEAFPNEKATSTAGLSYKIKSHIKGLESQAALYRPAPALEVLLALQQRQAPNTVLTEVSLDHERLMIKGEAGASRDIETLKAQLLGTGIEEAKITETGPSPTGHTSFTISARLSGK